MDDFQMLSSPATEIIRSHSLPRTGAYREFHVHLFVLIEFFGRMDRVAVPV